MTETLDTRALPPKKSSFLLFETIGKTIKESSVHFEKDSVIKKRFINFLRSIFIIGMKIDCVRNREPFILRVVRISKIRLLGKK